VFLCQALLVWDLQGLVAEDGQLYIIDPQNVDMQNSKHNSIQLDALQEFEQNIFKHHKRYWRNNTFLF
jgi:hypothetical protein